MPWPLPYILVIGLSLLVSFLVLGTVLLLRTAPRKRHRGPGGYLGYRQINPHVDLQAGVERARARQYQVKGRE